MIPHSLVPSITCSLTHLFPFPHSLVPSLTPLRSLTPFPVLSRPCVPSLLVLFPHALAFPPSLCCSLTPLRSLTPLFPAPSALCTRAVTPEVRIRPRKHFLVEAIRKSRPLKQLLLMLPNNVLLLASPSSPRHGQV